jgi:glutamate dehydrogenase (NAD(P)+)
VTQGGVNGRLEATDRGVFYVLREACRQHDDMRHLGLAPRLEGKRVVLQGIGNVGYWAAKFCRNAGARIVGIANRSCTIWNPDGIDEDELHHHHEEASSMRGFPGSTTIADPRACLELDCDILIPAAVENQIIAENAPRVKARIVVEGANGPTTPEADAILNEHGILVIPDVYANAGGVIVS